MSRRRPRGRWLRQGAAVVAIVAALIGPMTQTSVLAAPAAGRSDSYTVRPGDTLTAIAAWFGVPLQALMAANDIRNPNKIYVGQDLYIPDGGYGGRGGPDCVEYYRIDYGDTLSEIAWHYGLDAWELAEANGIYDLNEIFFGQRLCIPGDGYWDGRGGPVHYDHGDYGPGYGKPDQGKSGDGPYGGPQKGPDNPGPRNDGPQWKPDGYGAGHDDKDYPGKAGRGDKDRPHDGCDCDDHDDRDYDRHDDKGYKGKSGDDRYDGGPKDGPKPGPDYRGDGYRGDDGKPNHGGPKPDGYHPDYDEHGPKPDGHGGRNDRGYKGPNEYWRGQYFADKYLTEFVGERQDIAVRFNWYAGSPFDGVPNDYFSARWEKVEAFGAGTYRFVAVADDGVRVYVDDQLIINGWNIQPATEYKADIYLHEGLHKLVVEYFEEGNEAQIDVQWHRVKDHDPRR